MDRTDSSIHHKNNNLKVIIAFANFLGSDVTFHEVKKKEQVLAFLNTKVKDSNSDPEKRWVTTCNHYLNRIRLPNAIKNIQKDTAICLSYDLSIQCSRVNNNYSHCRAIPVL
jgi:hypothetical protein